MSRLASASEVEVGADFEIEGSVSVITEAAKIFIPLNELVDFEAERARLEKELEAARKDLQFVESKLNNPGFMAKAPEAVVAVERKKESDALSKIESITASLNALKK
jgi:valyl-tRNA synthetase